MNKYQKRAGLEMIGMIVLAVVMGLAMALITKYVTIGQFIAGIGIALMTYCGYTLFKIRVDQLKTLDEMSCK